MSIAISGYAGTCPCKNCQKALLLTPAQREIKKMRKRGQTLPRWAKDNNDKRNADRS